MLHDENDCCAPDEVKIQPAGLIPIGRPLNRSAGILPHSGSAGILPAGARASRSREWRGQDANAPAGETPAPRPTRHVRRVAGRSDT
jgi:hypothetical protein